MPDPRPTSTDLEALERFVVENDDLLELEERIGRFNIFDALRATRDELKHSNFLAWLLDPAESHGQGDLFLKAVVIDLLKHAPVEVRPLSPVDLDGVELQGVEVRREWNRIDLLVASKRPPLLIVVENKIDSGEHSDQLQRYAEATRRGFSDRKAMFVFLTREGDEPSEEGWVPYSYGDIHRVLTRVRKTTAGSLGGDVGMFLDHYLSLIGSRFMDDPKIDELCWRIYTHHRRAIDLIWEHRPRPEAEVLKGFADMLGKAGSAWLVHRQKTGAINFLPSSWPAVLAPISADNPSDRWAWVILTLTVFRQGPASAPPEFYLEMWIGPTTDVTLRNRVIDEFERDPALGLRNRRGRVRENRWTPLWSRKVASMDSDRPDGAASAVAQAWHALTDAAPRIQATGTMLQRLGAEVGQPPTP